MLLEVPPLSNIEVLLPQSLNFFGHNLMLDGFLSPSIVGSADIFMTYPWCGRCDAGSPSWRQRTARNSISDPGLRWAPPIALGRNAAPPSSQACCSSATEETRGLPPGLPPEIGRDSTGQVATIVCVHPVSVDYTHRLVLWGWHIAWDIPVIRGGISVYGVPVTSTLPFVKVL